MTRLLRYLTAVLILAARLPSLVDAWASLVGSPHVCSGGEYWIDELEARLTE